MRSIRDLRRRIRSISSTAQITKAMQMVAASKCVTHSKLPQPGGPLCACCTASSVRRRLGWLSFTSLLDAREVRKRAIILIGADKGLCGALNTNLFRMVARFDPNRQSSSPPDAKRNYRPNAASGRRFPAQARLSSQMPQPLPLSRAISF